MSCQKSNLLSQIIPDNEILLLFSHAIRINQILCDN